MLREGGGAGEFDVALMAWMSLSSLGCHPCGLDVTVIAWMCRDRLCRIRVCPGATFHPPEPELGNPAVPQMPGDCGFARESNALSSRDPFAGWDTAAGTGPPCWHRATLLLRWLFGPFCPVPPVRS